VPFQFAFAKVTVLGNGRGKVIKADAVCRRTPPEQMQVLPKRHRLWGYWVYVAALRRQDG